MPRRIAFLVFPQFQILDATGPIAAFEIAERYRPGTYALRTLATTPGAVASSSGACLQAAPLGRADTVDTLIVAGGEGTRAGGGLRQDAAVRVALARSAHAGSRAFARAPTCSPPPGCSMASARRLTGA